MKLNIRHDQDLSDSVHHDCVTAHKALSSRYQPDSLRIFRAIWVGSFANNQVNDVADQTLYSVAPSEGQ